MENVNVSEYDGSLSVGGPLMEMPFYWEGWRGGCLCGLVIVGERASVNCEQSEGSTVRRDAPWEMETPLCISLQPLDLEFFERYHHHHLFPLPSRLSIPLLFPPLV